MKATAKKFYELLASGPASPTGPTRLVHESYRDDPLGFCRDVLKVQVTPLQAEVLQSTLRYPWRTLVPSANEQGKTLVAAVTALWWYCTRSPAIVLTTAPRLVQVRDLLWKEIRRLARDARLDLPFSPKACRIERDADDFAFGTTAKDGTSFHGHHGPNMLFLFDEGNGVGSEIWEATESMFSPPGHAWLVIYNPTTTSTPDYDAYQSASKGQGRSWHTVRMSALEHPNIPAGLRGEPAPVPHAMRLDKFEGLLLTWSNLVSGPPLATDVQWPPLWAVDYCKRTNQQPRWYRPGPVAEARLLGRYPSVGTENVWSDGDWQAACREGRQPLPIPEGVIPEIGCDVARKGEDNTEVHIRCGPCSLRHFAANGLLGPAVVGHLKALAKWASFWFNDQSHNRQLFRRGDMRPIEPTDIIIKIDDDGVGGAIGDMLASDGYLCVGIGAGSKPRAKQHYPNKRSELWFDTATRARRDDLDLSRLEPDVLAELRRQAMAPTWEMDHAGRRVVEPKDETRKTIKRSPDGMDALNLAYYAADVGGVPTVLVPYEPPTRVL